MKMLKIIPEKIKGKIKYFLSTANHPDYLYIKKDEPKILVFLAGLYQNLGDMAITYSQKKFLQDLYPNHKIILVPSTKTYSCLKTIKKRTSISDIITIIGGGNMDDLYQSLEDVRLLVCNKFKNNKIISFPQTVHFSNTKSGIKSLNRSRKVYSKLKDFTLFTRENDSFNRAKQYFKKVNVKVCPDIVLYLNETEPTFKRENVLCCLRKDKEQNLSNNARENIINYLKNNYNNLLIRDTVDVKLEECTLKTYENTLKEFWSTIKTCKLVITDRLHCLIFCVITKTPCIVMDNSNKKISSVINQWLYDVDYIKLIENFNEDELFNHINNMINANFESKVKNLDKEFLPLKNACLNK